MTNGERQVCLTCGHPESEHVKGGCNHLTDLGPQEHGNPEMQMCSCGGFVGRRPANE